MFSNEHVEVLGTVDRCIDGLCRADGTGEELRAVECAGWPRWQLSKATAPGEVVLVLRVSRPRFEGSYGLRRSRRRPRARARRAFRGHTRNAAAGTAGA